MFNIIKKYKPRSQSTRLKKKRIRKTRASCAGAAAHYSIPECTDPVLHSIEWVTPEPVLAVCFCFF